MQSIGCIWSPHCGQSLDPEPPGDFSTTSSSVFGVAKQVRAEARKETNYQIEVQPQHWFDQTFPD